MRCIRGGVGREKRVGREVNGMEGSGEKRGREEAGTRGRKVV